MDLAVLAAAPVDPRALTDLREELAELLRRDVDLVDLVSASTVMRMQVVSKGALLHVAHEAERIRFEDLVFSSYARLNEERRAILDQVREQGSVYGR